MPWSPQELLRGLRTQDAAAWDEVHRRYQPLLVWAATRHRLRGQDVDDVVQTTWLRLVEHVGSLRNPEGLGGWLVTTCRRESLRLLRAQERTRPGDVDEITASIAASIAVGVADAAGDPFDACARQDVAVRLYAALDTLSRSQRALLVDMLTHPDDCYRTTSRRLGIPIGSIGPTRRRALERLQASPALQACR